MSVVVPFRLSDPLTGELTTRAKKLGIKRATLLTQIVTDYLMTTQTDSGSPGNQPSMSEVLLMLNEIKSSIAEVHDRTGEVGKGVIEQVHKVGNIALAISKAIKKEGE